MKNYKLVYFLVLMNLLNACGKKEMESFYYPAYTSSSNLFTNEFLNCWRSKTIKCGSDSIDATALTSNLSIKQDNLDLTLIDVTGLTSETQGFSISHKVLIDSDIKYEILINKNKDIESKNLFFNDLDNKMIEMEYATGSGLIFETLEDVNCKDITKNPAAANGKLKISFELGNHLIKMPSSNIIDNDEIIILPPPLVLLMNSILKALPSKTKNEKDTYKEKYDKLFNGISKKTIAFLKKPSEAQPLLETVMTGGHGHNQKKFSIAFDEKYKGLEELYYSIKILDILESFTKGYDVEEYVNDNGLMAKLTVLNELQLAFERIKGNFLNIPDSDINVKDLGKTLEKFSTNIGELKKLFDQFNAVLRSHKVDSLRNLNLIKTQAESLGLSVSELSTRPASKVDMTSVLKGAQATAIEAVRAVGAVGDKAGAVDEDVAEGEWED